MADPAPWCRSQRPSSRYASMRAARPSGRRSRRRAVGGLRGVERGDAAAVEEAAREADAAAVRDEQRGAAVAGHVAQAASTRRCCVGEALAAGEAERLGMLAVVPPGLRLLVHDRGEAARLPLAAVRLGQPRVDDERQLAAELLRGSARRSRGRARRWLVTMSSMPRPASARRARAPGRGRCR